MKCPKCGFNSFEFLDTCKKCGKDLSSFKATFGIRPVVVQAPEAPARTDEFHPLHAAPAGQAEEPELTGVTPGKREPPPQKTSAPPSPAATREGPPAAPARAVPRAPAAPPPELDEFSFEDTVIEPPKSPPEKGAPPPAATKAEEEEFSLEDFIGFGELDNGKAKAKPEEPAASLGKGGLDLDDFFGAEEPEEGKERAAKDKGERKKEPHKG